MDKQEATAHIKCLQRQMRLLNIDAIYKGEIDITSGPYIILQSPLSAEGAFVLVKSRYDENIYDLYGKDE